MHVWKCFAYRVMITLKGFLPKKMLSLNIRVKTLLYFGTHTIFSKTFQNIFYKNVD